MHYTVLVTGDDPEKQMTPFCESLDSVIKAEEEAFNERIKQDPNASTAPIYLERIDVLEDRKLDWEADKLKGKAEDTFIEYLNAYYYGDLKFLPKVIHQAKPEINVWESKQGGPGLIQEYSRWYWSLEYGNRFAVLGDNGEVEAVVVYAIAQPKWDWYEIGGRWKNFFKVKPEAITRVRYENAVLLSDRFKRDEYFNKLYPRTAEAPQEEPLDRSDQLMKGDVDFEGMREETRQKGLSTWDKFQEITGGQPFRTYDEMLAECNGDHTKARAAQEADPIDRAIRKTDFIWYDQDRLKLLRLPREEYANFCADEAFSTYSLLHNGKWEDRETFITDEPGKGKNNYRWEKRDLKEWNAHLWEVINSLPDNTLLTLIDYHS